MTQSTPDPAAQGLAAKARQAAAAWRTHGRRPWVRRVAGLLLLAAVLSVFLFALNPIAGQRVGPSGRRAAEQARTLAAENSGRLFPAWFTGSAYADFWGHRLSGDLGHSVLPRAYVIPTFGNFTREAGHRTGRTLILFVFALGLAAAAGSALGLPLARLRRRTGRPGALALLEVLGQVPVVTLSVFGVLLVVTTGNGRPDWRRVEGFDPVNAWDILIFPVIVLAVPLVPRIARFWSDLVRLREVPLDEARGPSQPVWPALRPAVTALADCLLLALGWIAVVEVAFGYTGLGAWVLQAFVDPRLAEGGLFFAAVVGLLAVALGGRPATYRPVLRAPVVGAPSHGPAPGPAGRGWFRHLAAHDGVIVGGYLLAFVAGVLCFAGFLPGMAAEEAGALQAYRPASYTFPMGSDVVGRNVWRMMVEGGRVLLPVALAVTLAAGLFAWAGGALSAGRPRVAGALGFLERLLAVYPGIWWPLAVVLVAGGGLPSMAVGLFLVSLPPLLAIFLPAAEDGPSAWSQAAGATRAVYGVGLVSVAGAQNFLVLAHLYLLGLGGRQAGPEWGAALRQMFTHPHADWILTAAPALLVLAMTLALFFPGRLILDQIDRARAAPAPVEKTSV